METLREEDVVWGKERFSEKKKGKRGNKLVGHTQIPTRPILLYKTWRKKVSTESRVLPEKNNFLSKFLRGIFLLNF